MRDVARVAGLSLQTVSRVANGEPNVNADTRDRVLGVMRDLGYRPNLAARAMRRGSFKTIGIVYQGLHAVGTRRTVEAVSEYAALKGYATTLMPIAAATGLATSGAFTRLEEMAVDVLVLIVTSQIEYDSKVQFPTGVPAILVGPQSTPEVSALDSDQTGGTAAAVRHLLDAGHRTVHHIAGAPGSFFAARREEVWRGLLEQEGRPVPRRSRAIGPRGPATGRCGSCSRRPRPRSIRRRSSRPTIRWRSARTAPSVRRGCGSRMTSRSWASTTSRRRRLLSAAHDHRAGLGPARA